MIDFLNDPENDGGRLYRAIIVLVLGLLVIGIINASNPDAPQPGANNSHTTTTIIIEDNDTCVSLYCGGN